MPVPSRQREAKLVRAAILARRTRDNIFPAELFSDPAWDMLLDLYLASLEDRRLSVTDACVGSIAPQTTALRWLDALCACSLVRRVADEADRRRTFVELTPKGEALMNSYFARVPTLWNGC